MTTIIYIINDAVADGGQKKCKRSFLGSLDSIGNGWCAICLCEVRVNRRVASEGDLLYIIMIAIGYF